MTTGEGIEDVVAPGRRGHEVKDNKPTLVFDDLSSALGGTNFLQVRCVVFGHACPVRRVRRFPPPEMLASERFLAPAAS